MNNPTETMGDIIARLERDLKSALEEIERQSFSRHGLEQENAALRIQIEALQKAHADMLSSAICAYCGQAVKRDFDAMHEHLLSCENRPERTYEIENTTLQVENAALRAMLKRLEWVKNDYSGHTCQICGV